MLDDLDVCGMNVGVGLDKVVAENGSELLGRIDGVLFGENVDGLFLGVCSDDRAVVGFGVASGISNGAR